MRPAHVASRLSVRVAAIIFVLGFALSTAVPVQAALTYEQVIMSDSPTAYWQFEESSTTLPAADTATGDGAQDGTYVGTGVGAVSLAPGKVGQAVYVLPLDPVGGYVEANGVKMTASFSVEAWARSNTATWNAFGWLPNERGPNGFMVHPDSGTTGFRGFLMNNGVPSLAYEQIGTAYAVPDIQAWHHYAVTYDDAAKVGRVYVDGVQVASKSGTTSVRDATSTINVVIGRDDAGTTSDRRGDGALDEVAVYHSALGADRIRARYFAPSGLATFSGPGDPNLDLSGYFVYAVNVGAVDPAYVGPTIGDAAFTHEGVPGASISSENRLFPAWGSKPEYGSSADDDALEDVMHSIRYDSSGTDPPRGVRIDLDVVPGNTYQLQLLFSENGATSRAFNIEIEGETLYADLDLMAVTGPWSGSPPLGVAFTHIVEATDSQLNILLGPGDPLTGLNRDAILNAFTLELVPEPSTLIIFGLGVVLLAPLGVRFRKRKK